MTRVWFILRELFRNLFRYPIAALSSFLSLTLILLLFDLFWVASGTSQKFYSDLLSDLQMELFIAEELPDSLLDTLSSSIAAIEGVKSVHPISRDSARIRLENMVGGDLLAGYAEENPLPRSFVLTFWPERLNLDSMASFEAQVTAMDEIDTVFYSRTWLEKAESARGMIWSYGTILGALILLTGLITTANSFRLMASSRVVGFRQMQLQGAGSLFISLPLLLEAFLLGGLSSAAGWLIISFSRGRIDFSRFTVVLPPVEQMVYFCIAVGLLALISGYLGLRRELKWRR